MFRKLFKYYTKSDWIVITVLASLAAAAFIFFHFIGGSLNSSNEVAEDSVRLADEFADKKKDNFYYAGEHKKETFPFDPNLADSTDLLRLGLSPYQVRNIYKYRAAGGVYQCKEDFAQLYGLTKGDYDRLAPYIVISEQFRPASDFVKRKSFSRRSNGNDNASASEHQGKANVGQSQQATETYNPKIKQGETIDVNSADTADLQRIPGIGPYYARQILYYSKQLGGFVRKEQLLEIEGFPEDALNYIEISGEVTKINVNKATLSQLRRHPYINFYQAKAITDYHRKNGPLKSLDDLRFLPQFKEQDIDRLAPYIAF